MNELSQWQARWAAQDIGFFYWALFCIAVAGLLIVIQRLWGGFSNVRVAVRLVGVGIFLGTLLPMVGVQNVLQALPPLVLAGGLGYSWHTYLGGRWPRLRRIGLSHILMLGMILRAPTMLEPFWYDETFTALIAGRPLFDAFAIIRGDVHPPGWYVIEWFNARLLGTSEIALRAPAFIAGLGLIWLVYRFTLALKLGRQTALAAALLVAVLPAPIYYSAEARPYSLLANLILLMVIGIIEKRPKLLGMGAMAAPMLHNLGYLYVAILGIAALALHRPRRRWVLALIPSASLGLLWIPTLVAQAQDVSDGFWLAVSPNSFLWPLVQMSVGWRIEDQFLLHSVAAVIGLTCLSVWRIRHWLSTRDGLIWIVLVLGAPSVAFVISLVWSPVYLARAFLASVMAVVVAWAWLFTRSNVGGRRSALACFAPAVLLCLGSSYVSTEHSRADLAGAIARGCAGADVIYNTSVHMHIISSYYSTLPQILWPWANDANQTLPSAAKKAAGWKQGEMPRGRVCVLDFDTLLSRQDERAYVQYLVHRYPVVSRRRVLYNSMFTLDAVVVDA